MEEENSNIQNNEEKVMEDSESNAELNNYKNEIKDEISRLKEQLNFLVKERDIIISSDMYNERSKLKIRKENLELELKKLKDEIYINFLTFDRPFKKYKRDSEQHKNLIEDYETNALTALLNDSNLKIINVLEEMSKKINGGDLCSKEKKAQKVLKQIDKMDTAYFKNFLEKYNSIIIDYEEVKKQLEKNDTEEKIKEIESKEHKFSSDIDEMEQKLKEADNKFIKKFKKCPNCGQDIPSEWKHHKECGWDKSKDQKKEEESSIGKVKIEVFTSPTCPHCHPALDFAKQIAKQIKKERGDYIKVVELSTATPSGQKKATQFGVMSVPTTFVTGPKSAEKIAFRGLPSKKGLLKAIDISLGLSEWEEPPKGFFKRLWEKFA